MNTAIAPYPVQPDEGGPHALELPPSFERENGPGQARSTLQYYLRLIERDRWRILTFALVVTTAVSLGVFALPKQYQGDAAVRVDPVGVQVAGQSSQSLDRSDSELLLETERNVVTSPAILVNVIRALHLDQDPEFKVPANGDANTKMDSLVRQVSKKLSVDAPVGTLLLNIHFRSHSPALAASVTNSVVTNFIDQEYASRADALRESTKYMTAQLGDMRASMERDQQALVDYQSANNVLDPQDKQNIYASRLSQVNLDYTAAQATRMQIQSDYEAAASGEVDALIAAGGPNQSALQLMRQRLRDDTRQLAKLATVYGNRHPLYQEQQQVVQQDTAAMNLAAAQVTAQLQAKLRAAVIRERLLGTDLQQEKSAMDAFNQRAIRYSMLKAAADSSSRLYYDLLQQIQNNNVAAGLKTETLRVVSLARVPDRAVFPNIPLAIGLALILSTLLGIWGSIAAAMLDHSVSRPDQVEQLFGLQVLGSLPQRAVGLVRTDTGATPSVRTTPFDEAILTLRSALLFHIAAEGSVVAVTSALPGEGKSTVAASLARSLAAAGRSVVLVDCDLRKPSVHRTMQVENRHGLGGVLSGSLELEEALAAPAGEVVKVLPAGHERVGPELLHGKIGSVVEKLRQQFDYVILDCPPTLGFSDVGAVGRYADGIIVVVHAGKTARNFLQAALRQLRSMRGNILGVVLNRVSSNLDDYYSYYSDKGYSDYYQEADS